MLYQKLVKILCLAMLAVGCSSEGDNYYSCDEGMGGAMAAAKNKNGRTGWSQAGVLETANRNKVVPLTAHFQEPDNFTVQFQVQSLDGHEIAPGPPALKAISRPQALIEWSVGGNTTSRIVDVFQGTSLSGQAETVTVKLYDATLSTRANENVLAAPGLSYPASIQVTKGRRTSTLMPTLQAVSAIQAPATPVIFYGGIPIGPGQNYLFTIPKNSGVQSFQFIAKLLNALPADFEVYCQDSSGSLANIYSQDLQGIWLPMPSGCNTVRFRNQGAAFVNATLFFGIDG